MRSRYGDGGIGERANIPELRRRRVRVIDWFDRLRFRSVAAMVLSHGPHLGETPARVLKTLMALVDRKPVCVIVPSDREVSMKKLAAVFKGKSAEMMPPADVGRMTGYKVGGISPFGQMRKVPVAIEAQSLSQDLVYLNGGQRGLQVRLNPSEAARVLGAASAPLVVD